MALIELKPKQRTIEGNPREQVRVSFLNKKSKNVKKDTKMVMIHIGADIAHALNVTNGDKMAFFYDSENSFIWTLKKSDTIGYSLQKPRQGDSSFYLQIIWNVAPISANELGIKIVRHEIKENSVVIYYNECLRIEEDFESRPILEEKLILDAL